MTGHQAAVSLTPQGTNDTLALLKAVTKNISQLSPAASLAANGASLPQFPGTDGPYQEYALAPDISGNRTYDYNISLSGGNFVSATPPPSGQLVPLQAKAAQVSCLIRMGQGIRFKASPAVPLSLSS
jgi:hypothetical protein